MPVLDRTVSAHVHTLLRYAPPVLFRCGSFFGRVSALVLLILMFLFRFYRTRPESMHGLLLYPLLKLTLLVPLGVAVAAAV